MKYIVLDVVHTPTNALSINLVKSFKFTLKYTIISLLHVSVFNDHHQGALSVLHCTQHTCRSTGYILKSTQFTHQQMHYLLVWLKVLNLH